MRKTQHDNKIQLDPRINMTIRASTQRFCQLFEEKHDFSLLSPSWKGLYETSFTVFLFSVF